MRRTSCATSRVLTGLVLASALCVPAAALAAQFDYFIKLPPIEGDSGKGASHGDEIEIHSFSWGASQSSHAGGGGMGAGKVSMQDISIPSATSGKGEIVGIEPAYKASGESRAARTAGKDVVMKGSKIGENAAAGVGGSQTISIGGARTESGLPTGKRQHKPLMLAKPLPAGSVTVRGKFPSCTVGTRYPSLELGARGERYTLQDVVVTSCGGSAGESLPMEEVSFNYAKIET